MSVSSAREEILRTIGDCLRNSRSSTVLGAVTGPAPVKQNGDAVAFEAAVTRVGGHFYKAHSAEDAGERVISIALEHAARSIIAWDNPLIEAIRLGERAAANGLTYCEDDAKGDVRKSAADSDIGVTFVDYALAETGSLVLLSREGQARSISLLPPVHVALVIPSQVLPGFDELFALLESGENRLPSAVTFITGPSRTADIELTLVVGVHGPQELHVVLFDAI